MRSITFECETITPMFLAGADGQTPELRPPSIKGALRFWWRAMNGHLDLKTLKEREGEIFGNGGEKATKSLISIDVEPNYLNIAKQKLDGKTFKVKGHKVDILDYLAYGTNSYKKKIKSITFDREYILPNQNFNIEVSYKNNIDRLSNIIHPLVLMSRVGGLGSKTRNGFGMFNIKKAINCNDEEIKLPHITELLKKQGKLQSHLSLSDSIKTYQLKNSDQNAINVLSDLGLIYKNIREGIEDKHEYYKRSFLASPLQVKKKNKGLLERHAKSYFLSVSKSGEKYKGYIYFIPYDFLKGFDELSEKEYNELINRNHQLHSDLEDNEYIQESFYTEEYNRIHKEFNSLLSEKMKQL